MNPFIYPKSKHVRRENDRAEILSSIKYIDQIVTYNTEAELLALLQVTNFDVRILGSDYVGKTYTGDNLNKPAHFHTREHNYSLTDLKEKIYEERKSYKDKNAR